MSQPIQTAAFWDGSADGYIASAEPFTAQFCLDAVELAGIRPGVTLIDIATGPGALAIAAAKAGAEVTAIDFSATMIERLRTRIGDLPIVAEQMDGQALNLPDAAFDIACSVFGIPLFPDWRAGLRELVRVLKPGGQAVVAVADNPYGFGPNQLFAQARARLYPAIPIENLIAMDLVSERASLLAAFSTAGIGGLEIHERTHDFRLDPAMLASDNPMLAYNPLLSGLGAEEQQCVVREAAAEAMRSVRADSLSMPGTARIVVGTKL